MKACTKVGVIAVSLVLILGVALVSAQEKKGSPASIKGEVIDIYCYVDHGDSGKGPDHKECAKKCIEGGLPVGILEDGTNKVYLAVGTDHESAKDLLLPHVAQKVEVTGKTLEGKGITVFEISSVKKLE